MMPRTHFLQDRADNLDLRADFIELRNVVNAKCDAKPALRQLLSHLKPYRERIGHNHATQRPLQQGLLDQLRRLRVPALTQAVNGTAPGHDGYLANPIHAVEQYVSSWASPVPEDSQ